MARNLEERVEMAGSFFHNARRTVTEAYIHDMHEGGGKLIGIKEGNIYNLITAYPHVTGIGTKDSYDWDEKTVEILEEIDKSATQKKGPKPRMIGEYHSHTYEINEEMVDGLSEEDIDNIISKKIKKHRYWIELLFKVRHKDISERQLKKSKYTLIQFPKKLRVFIRYKLKEEIQPHSFDIIISAYKITKKPKLKIKELKVSMSQVEVKRKLSV